LRVSVFSVPKFPIISQILLWESATLSACKTEKEGENRKELRRTGPLAFKQLFRVFADGDAHCFGAFAEFVVKLFGNVNTLSLFYNGTNMTKQRQLKGETLPENSGKGERARFKKLLK
jgi:hypothetical protein